MRRETLTKRNLTYYRWRYLDNGRRTLRAVSSQKDFPDTARIAQEITEQGIVTGPSSRYLSDDGRQALEQSSKLVLDISRSPDVQAIISKRNSESKKDYLIQLVPWDHQHLPDSPLLRLALDEKLLEIVASYLGLWPRLHAIGAWLNFPTDDPPKRSQIWHRDPEDRMLIKAFIYLVDVDENGGPFSYIPKTHPFHLGAAKVPERKDKKGFTDDEMRATIPPETWRTCTGPANTMILADTVGYHRGGKPTKNNRILITFTYTGSKPFSDRVLRVEGKPIAAGELQRYALD